MSHGVGIVAQLIVALEAAPKGLSMLEMIQVTLGRGVQVSGSYGYGHMINKENKRKVYNAIYTMRRMGYKVVLRNGRYVLKKSPVVALPLIRLDSIDEARLHRAAQCEQANYAALNARINERRSTRTDIVTNWMPKHGVRDPISGTVRAPLSDIYAAFPDRVADVSEALDTLQREGFASYTIRIEDNTLYVTPPAPREQQPARPPIDDARFPATSANGRVLRALNDAHIGLDITTLHEYGWPGSARLSPARAYQAVATLRKAGYNIVNKNRRYVLQ